jgi:hypothetical protein
MTTMGHLACYHILVSMTGQSSGDGAGGVIWLIMWTFLLR